MKPSALAAYLAERFPPVNMGLFAILFLTVFAVATAPASPAPGWREAGGILAAVSFFFRLRVFDEIKDYAADALYHPRRVLQSGRVTLRQLGGLAAGGAVLEAAWSAAMGLPALLGWALALGYSLAMRYEFGVGGFLKKRLLLYAFTHLLVMPLVIGWLWAAYSSEFSLRFGYLAVLSLLGGGAFEVARKIRAPDAERPGVDSYSGVLGYRGAIAAVGVILAAGSAVQAGLLRALDAGPWPFAWLVGLLLLTGAVYARAWFRPAERLLRRAELLVSLFMLTSYLALLGEVWF